VGFNAYQSDLKIFEKVDHFSYCKLLRSHIWLGNNSDSKAFSKTRVHRFVSVVLRSLFCELLIRDKFFTRNSTTKASVSYKESR